MSDSKGKPASFTDIAFDSGRIYERIEIIKMLEGELKKTTLPNGVVYIESTIIKRLIQLIAERANNDRTN